METNPLGKRKVCEGKITFLSRSKYRFAIIEMKSDLWDDYPSGRWKVRKGKITFHITNKKNTNRQFSMLFATLQAMPFGNKGKDNVKMYDLLFYFA